MAATIRTGSPPKTPRSQQGSAPLTSSFLGSPTGKAAYVVSPPRSPSGSPFSVMSQAPTQTMGSPILESGGVLVETVRVRIVFSPFRRANKLMYSARLLHQSPHPPRTVSSTLTVYLSLFQIKADPQVSQTCCLGNNP